MIFNKFANSDVKISSIGFGTWALGSNKATGYGKINIREAINTIHKSIEKKINKIKELRKYQLCCCECKSEYCI